MEATDTPVSLQLSECLHEDDSYMGKIKDIAFVSWEAYENLQKVKQHEIFYGMRFPVLHPATG